MWVNLKCWVSPRDVLSCLSLPCWAVAADLDLSHSPTPRLENRSCCLYRYLDANMRGFFSTSLSLYYSKLKDKKMLLIQDYDSVKTAGIYTHTSKRKSSFTNKSTNIYRSHGEFVLTKAHKVYQSYLGISGNMPSNIFGRFNFAIYPWLSWTLTQAENHVTIDS